MKRNRWERALAVSADSLRVRLLAAIETADDGQAAAIRRVRAQVRGDLDVGDAMIAELLCGWALTRPGLAEILPEAMGSPRVRALDECLGALLAEGESK